MTSRSRSHASGNNSSNRSADSRDSSGVYGLARVMAPSQTGRFASLVAADLDNDAPPTVTTPPAAIHQTNSARPGNFGRVSHDLARQRIA